MGFRLAEHRQITICKAAEIADISEHEDTLLFISEEVFDLFKDLKSKNFSKDSYCFHIKAEEDRYTLVADYFIGVDWLGKSGRTVLVEPKLNAALSTYFDSCLQKDEDEISDTFTEHVKSTDIKEVNYLKMLLDIMSHDTAAKHAADLVKIDWEAPKIKIAQKDDQLTPFLVIQFLQLLKAIVRKGLKSSYYRVQHHLRNRVKGKILVGAHIKANIFKNRLTSTLCEYQEFGTDNPENRFIKKVFVFCSSYVEKHKESLFKHTYKEVEHLMYYCRPAFEKIGDHIDEIQLKNFKYNPFFKEYAQALKIGKHILKRFSYTISRTAEEEISTPPFWIDMPRLFESYLYYQLLKANPADAKYIHYQFSTYGNALDILISKPGCEMVIDAKYKMHYNTGQIHEDIRQVSGYARLNKVIGKVKQNNPLWSEDALMDCLIVYPSLQKASAFDFSLTSLKLMLNEQTKIKAYRNVYKLGVHLPLIE